MVDALVSNTSGATRAGSTPALGTKKASDFQRLFFVKMKFNNNIHRFKSLKEKNILLLLFFSTKLRKENAGSELIYGSGSTNIREINFK